LRWPLTLTPKKQFGAEQEEFVMLGTHMPSYPLSTHLPTKNHDTSGPVRVSGSFISELRISCFGKPLAQSGLIRIKTAVA
jgi:hypothetical protein